MPALNRAPCIELGGAERQLLVRVPADAGRIEDHVRAAQRGESRTFGVPLIPANLHANASVGAIEIGESEIAGSEIKFFVIKGVLRDVHLAVFAEQGAVCVEDCAGVVVNAGSAA